MVFFSVAVPGKGVWSRELFSPKRGEVVYEMHALDVLHDAPDHPRQHHVDGLLQPFLLSREVVRWGYGHVDSGARGQGLEAFDHGGVFGDELRLVPYLLDDVVGAELQHHDVGVRAHRQLVLLREKERDNKVGDRDRGIH